MKGFFFFFSSPKDVDGNFSHALTYTEFFPCHCKLAFSQFCSSVSDFLIYFVSFMLFLPCILCKLDQQQTNKQKHLF